LERAAVAPRGSRATHVRRRAYHARGDKQTRVTLHHTGWGDGGEWDKAYAYFDRAWGNVLPNLAKRFETGPVDWTDWMQRMRQMQQAPPAPK